MIDRLRKMMSKR